MRDDEFLSPTCQQRVNYLVSPWATRHAYLSGRSKGGQNASYGWINSYRNDYSAFRGIGYDIKSDTLRTLRKERQSQEYDTTSPWHDSAVRRILTDPGLLQAKLQGPTVVRNSEWSLHICAALFRVWRIMLTDAGLTMISLLLCGGNYIMTDHRKGWKWSTSGLRAPRHKCFSSRTGCLVS